MVAFINKDDLIEIGRIRKESCSTKRILIREHAENLAIEILDSSTPYTLTHDDVENIIRLLNYDYYRDKVHYTRFDQTFMGQNLTLILGTDIEIVNEAISELYWNEDLDNAMNIVSKVQGAKFGFISGFLYLKDREKYNIFLEKLETGVKNLFPATTFSDPFRQKYQEYNQLVNSLKNRLKIKPQEMDIILTDYGNK